MSELLGIDVSHHNGSIDWGKVAKAGKRFAIMKCQYEAQSHNKDECFEANYAGAGVNGLARGVYLFVGSRSIENPIKDAKSLLGHLNGRKLEYGIWLDYESAALRTIGKEAIKDLTYIYADMFREAGYYVGIYCNKDWYDNVIHDDLKKDFDFWIARYPAKDTGEYNAESKLKPQYDKTVAWQYSSKGKVDGIKGNVDLNVDYDGIIELASRKKKTVDEIAQEVLLNLWGTRFTTPTRRERLEAEGYDYNLIQKRVNQLIFG